MDLRSLILEQKTYNVGEMPSELAKEVQTRLSLLGYYPANMIDGIPGNRTKLAFSVFKQRIYQSQPEIIGPGSAQKLLDLTENKDKPAVLLATVLLKNEEKLSLAAYPDPKTHGAPYTNGYGSTRKPDGKPWVLGEKITAEEAEDILQHDLTTDVLPGCRRIPYWGDLKDHQQAALLSFAYNVGSMFYGTRDFETITKVLRLRDYDKVPAALMLYVDPGTEVEEGLRNRRAEEIKMWNGEYKVPTLVGRAAPFSLTLADRIHKVCQQRGYPLHTAPGEVNIVGLEGVNSNNTPNNDAPNKWNDLVGLLTFENGRPCFKILCVATTEPGSYYTYNPLNPNGAARLQLGLQKGLWVVGQHRGYEAMQQAGTATLVRDRNKNFLRDDIVTVESGNGIDLHTTKTTGWKGSAGDTVDKWSAGCVVIEDAMQFLEFMRLVKSSKQYTQNPAYRFDFVLLFRDWLFETTK